MCSMKNCNKCILLEGRNKRDLYMWISNTPNGPSGKFLVESGELFLQSFFYTIFNSELNIEKNIYYFIIYYKFKNFKLVLLYIRKSCNKLKYSVLFSTFILFDFLYN